jgi:hypothetical protein
MHTFGYVASALFFLVEIGLFLGFVGSLIIGQRTGKTEHARLWKLYRGTMAAMVLAIGYPVLMILFTASLGAFDSFGVVFLVLAIIPVALERGLM